MSKKIGILTFHGADNLGAVLQTFALQNTIEKNFSDSVKVIDYRCETVEITKFVKKPSSVKELIKYIPMSIYYGIKRRSFNKFRKIHLNLSQRCDKFNISKITSDYDVFITGSDQIWNPGCSGDDYTYFLDFLKYPALSASYAASIGPYKYNSEERNKVASLLENYDYISVREQSGAEQLKEMGIKNVSVNPDPVTLLSPDEWKPYMSKRLCKQKYVLVYLILPDVNVTTAAEKYAKEHNCKIINNKKSIEFILKNSPSDFLSWVYNAECIFTNSFHGTAFSLIFNKPLGADVTLSDGGINNRVNDFLKCTGAENCIINSNDLIPQKVDISESLSKLKFDAMEYLNTICQ